jgi:Zn-dependent protease/CBS domain-containing protein
LSTPIQVVFEIGANVMEGNIKIGQLWGIPIGIHLSWIIIFGLLTWSLAGGYFPDEYPDLTGFNYVLMAVLTSLLFFGSVLAHELGHSLVALRENIPVKGITLFIFGGIAQIEKEPPTPGAEFRIAIAGPLVSLGLAGLFGLLYLLDQAIPVLAAPTVWLARINLILAVFNMVPGFPLDGGRVLRAIVWKVTNNAYQATRVATFTGQIIAFGFMGLGVFLILQGNILNGIWIAFIGWFLQNAAAVTYSQASLQKSLRGIHVDQVMKRDFPRVSPLSSLQQLVDEQVLQGGRRYFYVMDDENPVGIITLKDISEISQRKWAFTTTRQAMRPLEKIVSVQPNMELITALQAMDQAEVSQIPVMDGRELLGTLAREDILHYIRLKSDLGL